MQRYSLFREFGGDEKGYIGCPGTGLKLHYTSDPELNPHGYPLLERGKVFLTCQGGGYELENLIPESFAANRARKDKPVRPENLDRYRPPKRSAVRNAKLAAIEGKLRQLADARKRVRAKRAGWDEPPEGLVTKYDILDPPAWRDEGLSEDLEGVLKIREYEGYSLSSICHIPPGKVYLVGGQEADPRTIVPL
jgi:hypothetical protein